MRTNWRHTSKLYEKNGDKKIGGGIDSNGGKNNIKNNGQFNSVHVESYQYTNVFN